MVTTQTTSGFRRASCWRTWADTSQPSKLRTWLEPEKRRNNHFVTRIDGLWHFFTDVCKMVQQQRCAWEELTEWCSNRWNEDDRFLIKKLGSMSVSAVQLPGNGQKSGTAGAVKSRMKRKSGRSQPGCQVQTGSCKQGDQTTCEDESFQVPSVWYNEAHDREGTRPSTPPRHLFRSSRKQTSRKQTPKGKNVTSFVSCKQAHSDDCGGHATETWGEHRADGKAES